MGYAVYSAFSLPLPLPLPESGVIAPRWRRATARVHAPTTSRSLRMALRMNHAFNTALSSPSPRRPPSPSTAGVFATGDGRKGTLWSASKRPASAVVEAAVVSRRVSRRCICTSSLAAGGGGEPARAA